MAIIFYIFSIIKVRLHPKLKHWLEFKGIADWIKIETVLHCFHLFLFSIVGLKLKAYESRVNGGMGIYWNLHISIEEIYKFVFLHVKYLFFCP